MTSLLQSWNFLQKYLPGSNRRSGLTEKIYCQLLSPMQVRTETGWQELFRGWEKHVRIWISFLTLRIWEAGKAGRMLSGQKLTEGTFFSCAGRILQDSQNGWIQSGDTRSAIKVKTALNQSLWNHPVSALRRKNSAGNILMIRCFL